MNQMKLLTLLLGLTALVTGAYFVKKGDTLWDLSETFLNDPFAWPDLWENNRHIEDPHWIYPGDSIYFGENDSVSDTMPPAQPKDQNLCNSSIPDSALPKTVTPVGCDENDSRGDQFENLLGNLRSKSKIEKKKKVTDEYFYQQRPESKIFNGYYQVLSPDVLKLDELKNDSRWFSVQSGERSTPLLHMPENEIVVGVGYKTNSNIKKGGLVEVWQTKTIEYLNPVSKNTEKTALLQIGGYAKITAIGDTLSRAILVQSFKEINIEKSKAKLKEPYSAINVKGYSTINEVKVDEMGYVLYSIDPALVIGAYSYIIIDKGTKSGYNAGDGVAIWEEDLSDPGLPPRLLGRGIVTRAKQEQATVLIREIYSNNRRIKLGHRISLTHKAQLVQ